MMLSPALAHIIERPRLTRILDESGARLILLAAPAGYGKTTLAQQWADKQPPPVAWYRATRASADVAALAVGLDASLSTLSRTTKPDPERLEAIAAANPKPEPLARALLKRHGSLPREALLVIDEYESAASEDAERLLAIVIDALPIRYLITSRAHPPWFARMAVYGHGRALGVDALSMTEDEAREVLSQRLPTDAAQSLLAIADGWPAIIGLAAIDPTGELPEETLLPQTLYDFLAGELLASAPAEIQQAVLLIAAASISEVSVARLVLGDQTDAALTNASTRGLLVVIGNEARISIHPLLRELVLARLRRGDNCDRSALIDQLRTLREHGRWEECVSAAEAIADASFATETLRSATDELLHAGRVTTLRRLVEIGRTSGGGNLFLDYVEGEISLRAGDLDLALALGVAATKGLGKEEVARAHLLAAHAAHLTDRQALAVAHYDAAKSTADAEVRAAALWGLSVEAFDQQRPDSQSALAAFSAEAAPTPENRLRTASGTIKLGILNGNLVQRLLDAEFVLPLLPRVADPMSLTGFLNSYGYALLLRGEYARAVAALDQIVTAAKEFGLDFAARYVLHLRAAAFIGLRRFSLADRVLTQLEQQVRSTPDPFLEANTLMQRARLHVSTGNPQRATDVLVLDPDTRNNKGTRGEYLAVRALALAASGSTRDAVETSGRARDASSLIEVSALTSMALAISAAEDGASGTTIIKWFVTALETEVVDAVVIGLRASPKLLQEVAAQSQWQRDLQRILLKSNDAALAARAGLPIPREARRTRALSTRELEIHELIAQGLTNPEIARLLYISASTTKVHVHHILEKLGVRSRVEAARIWQAPDGEG